MENIITIKKGVVSKVGVEKLGIVFSLQILLDNNIAYAIILISHEDYKY